MENSKGLPRSHYTGYDSQPGPGARKQYQQRKPHRKAPSGQSDGRSHGPGPGLTQDHGFPLFNNRSLSVLSTMHHLNPHRKVAMSPEILREAEEQASTLRKAVKQLQDQLEKTNREKARIHRFLSDLLYTLNARGYESVRDHEGTLVDLNKCKGETYLDLKGRDLKQRVNVRRQGGQEFLLKAVIGNQERAIQSLVFRLDSLGRDIVLGNRLTLEDSNTASPSSAGDSSKVASLEAEVLQLVNLIEGACQRCPDMYMALREHYYLNEENDAGELSPRNPVLHNLLRKCEQIAGDAQSKQLVEMLTSNHNHNSPAISAIPKGRPKSQQNSATTSAHGPSKSEKKKPTKIKTASGTKAPRAVSSETTGNVSQATAQRTMLESLCGHSSRDPSYDGHLKPLNGTSRSENSLHQFMKGFPSRFPTSSQTGATLPLNSGGEPSPPFLNTNKSSLDHFVKDCSVTVCPYCQRKFGIEESISEIKNHIEMHVFAGDATLT